MPCFHCTNVNCFDVGIDAWSVEIHDATQCQAIAEAASQQWVYVEAVGASYSVVAQDLQPGSPEVNGLIGATAFVLALAWGFRQMVQLMTNQR